MERKNPGFAATNKKNTKLAVSILGDRRVRFQSYGPVQGPAASTSPESVYRKVRPMNEKAWLPKL